MRLEPAADADFTSICCLLTAARLPTDGLREHLRTGLVMRHGGELVGCVALEPYGDAALLRSLVVAPSHRHAGAGRALTRAALDLGRRAGVTRFYLLTTTAPRFFARHFGFHTVERSAVPAAVSRSVAFAHACPSTAEAMVLHVPAATVIFACLHNAGRSQMAAAFFNALAHPERARAVSAGTQPGERVHPEVQQVMREDGFELSGIVPRRLTAELAAGGALLVTMGCGEACPVVPGLERDDWNLPDPKGQPLDVVRTIRDDIQARVRRLVEMRHWERGLP